MREVGTILGLAVTIAVLICAVQAADHDDMNPNKYYMWHTHDFQQDVSGDGYIMVYQKVDTNNLSLDNYMHGSGTADFATLIHSEQKKSKTIDYYNVKSGDRLKATGYVESYKNYDSRITFSEQNQMTYSPVSFPYGTGWYAEHPVTYNSLLKERTTGSNYQAGASMLHQIEYARAFQKDIDIDLNCTGKTDKADGAGIAKMNIEEDVTMGTVHIAELLTRDRRLAGSKENPKLTGIRSPLIEIDENYIGNFKIKKSMSINAPKAKVSPAEDWLPCCFGGFADINDWEKKGAVSGIFDCTCHDTVLKGFKPAYDGTTAQFPREY